MDCRMSLRWWRCDKGRADRSARGGGAGTIECGSFVSPKRVPQMANTAEVLAAIERAPGVVYSVLVPNLQGLEAALDSRGRRNRRFCRSVGKLFATERSMLDRRKSIAPAQSGGWSDCSPDARTRLRFLRTRLPV